MWYRPVPHLDPPHRALRAGLGAVLLLAAVALILVGCIRAEISIKVNEDGSGEVSVLAAFDVEVFEAFTEDLGGAAGSSELPTFSDIAEADLPPGASVEEYDEDGFTGARLTIPFEATDDIAATVDQALADAGTGDDDGGLLTGADNPFEDFQLRREGDGWRFEATAAPVSEGTEGEDAFGLGGAIFDLLLDDASFEIKVELPGDLIEHNADRIDGNTLVWELGLTDTEPRQLLAVTGAAGGDGGFNLVLALVVIALIIAVAAGAAWFFTQTRSASGGV